MHFNCRNLNGTVLLQSLTTSCWLYTWEQRTNSCNKFVANLNMKGISFFYSLCIMRHFNLNLMNYHSSPKTDKILDSI